VSNGVITLAGPISFPIVNSNTLYQPKTAIVNASIIYNQSASLAPQLTENNFNVAQVTFSNLTPQAGTVSKIRSYFKSAGVGEYILSNETDISSYSTKFGYTPDSISISFATPTIHRNDRIDFKFEFVNPYGKVSDYTVESLNNLFIGGNTYIGGDDNLLTGSLFVASETGTGVQITGKNSTALVKSIGYQGLSASLASIGTPGFVLYSGSIQSVLGSLESYSGVGLEMAANSSSYFKYTTANGGLIDIHTDKFFIGNSNTYLSGSNGNLEILVRDPTPPLTKFHLQTNGAVTASAFVAFTGSSDTNAQKMLDTSIGLVDGKNIGRTIYALPVTSIISSAWTASTLPGPNTLYQSGDLSLLYYTSSLNWYSIFSDQATFLLPWENTITVFGNAWVDKTSGTLDDCEFSLLFRFGLTMIDTGSFSNFGTSTATSFTGVSGSINSSGLFITPTGSYKYTYTLPPTRPLGSATKSTPFKVTISIPTNFSNQLCLFNGDYAPTFVNGGINDNNTVEVKIANIYAYSSRTLANSTATGTGGGGYLPSDSMGGGVG